MTKDDVKDDVVYLTNHGIPDILNDLVMSVVSSKHVDHLDSMLSFMLGIYVRQRSPADAISLIQRHLPLAAKAAEPFMRDIPRPNSRSHRTRHTVRPLASPRSSGRDHYSALCRAIILGDEKTAWALIDANGPEADLDGNSALLYSVLSKNDAMTKKMLDRGLHPFTVNNFGEPVTQVVEALIGVDSVTGLLRKDEAAKLQRSNILCERAKLFVLPFTTLRGHASLPAFVDIESQGQLKEWGRGGRPGKKLLYVAHERFSHSSDTPTREKFNLIVTSVPKVAEMLGCSVDDVDLFIDCCCTNPLESTRHTESIPYYINEATALLIPQIRSNFDKNLECDWCRIEMLYFNVLHQFNKSHTCYMEKNSPRVALVDTRITVTGHKSPSPVREDLRQLYQAYEDISSVSSAIAFAAEGDFDYLDSHIQTRSLTPEVINRALYYTCNALEEDRTVALLEQMNEALNFKRLEPLGLITLCKCLGLQPGGVTAIELEGCELTLPSVSALAGLCAASSSLKSLSVRDCGLADVYSPIISEGVQKSHSITSLDVSHNALCIVSAQALAKAVTSDQCKITKLNLEHNNIHSQGFSELRSAVTSPSPLRELNVSHNQIKEDGIISMFSNLGSTLCITHLNISRNTIGGKGAEELFDAAAKSPQLKYLDINCCGLIDSEGALGKLAGSHVNYLNISGNLMGHSALNELGRVLNSTSITHLRASDCNCGHKGLESLCQALPSNKTLVLLDLSCNGIGLRGVQMLAKGLSDNSKLSELNLEDNGIPNEGGTAVISLLKTNHVLRAVGLSGNVLRGSTSEEIKKILENRT